MSSDISGWSQELHVAFDYLNYKQHKHKETALKVLDILFNKLKHDSYFDKIILGSKQKIQEHEEFHIVLGYVDVVAATTTVLL